MQLPMVIRHTTGDTQPLYIEQKKLGTIHKTKISSITQATGKTAIKNITADIKNYT